MAKRDLNITCEAAGVENEDETYAQFRVEFRFSPLFS